MRAKRTLTTGVDSEVGKLKIEQVPKLWEMMQRA